MSMSQEEIEALMNGLEIEDDSRIQKKFQKPKVNTKR